MQLVAVIFFILFEHESKIRQGEGSELRKYIILGVKESVILVLTVQIDNRKEVVGQ